MIYTSIKITAKNKNIYDGISNFIVENSETIGSYFINPKNTDIYIILENKKQECDVMKYLESFSDTDITISNKMQLSITYSVSGGNIDKEPEESEFDKVNKTFKVLDVYSDETYAYDSLETTKKTYPEYNAFMIAVCFSEVVSSSITPVYAETIACYHKI